MKVGNPLRRPREQYINGKLIVGRWGQYAITVKADEKTAMIPRVEATLNVGDEHAR
jgi:hypothetical protein